MAFQVFVSYSSRNDQVTALRLQTLAAAHGLQVYVPPASTRSGGFRTTGDGMERAVQQSDVLLAVITGALTPAVQGELETAARLNKPVLPIVTVRAVLQSPFLRQFQQAVYLDPSNPGEAEAHLVQALNQMKIQKQNKQVLIALTALVIGLLLLSKD